MKIAGTYTTFDTCLSKLSRNVPKTPRIIGQLFAVDRGMLSLTYSFRVNP